MDIKDDDGKLIAHRKRTPDELIEAMNDVVQIPGLNNLTGKDTQENYATLLIVITPHVIRGTQAAGHTPMMRVEKSTAR